VEFDKEQISGMKILVVDDAPENLDILGHILQRSGLEISIAPTGEKALELINLSKPDLILLDVRMQGMDGYEVCRKLKADVNTKDIPVIFITAMAGTEDLVRGYNAGGIDYITKPFNEEEVVCRITNQLNLEHLHEMIKNALNQYNRKISL